jgi:hypothetical protein
MTESPLIELLTVGDDLAKEDGLGTKFAEIELKFPDFGPPEGPSSFATAYFLVDDLNREIGIIANVRFQEFKVITRLEIRKGSLILILSLWASVPTVYKFFKDYTDLRKGVLAFVGDLRTSASWLHSTVQKHLCHNAPEDSKDSK